MCAVRRTLRIAAAAIILFAAAAAIASPAGAAPGHTSCKDLGQLTASEGRARTIAVELKSYPRGTVDDVIALVQLGGTFGDEVVPPFCTPK